MRVLLVEDNEPLVEWLLRKERFVVDCVARGDEADAVLWAQAFDLVVLDLALSDMGGVDPGTRVLPAKQFQFRVPACGKVPCTPATTASVWSRRTAGQVGTRRVELCCGTDQRGAKLGVGRLGPAHALHHPGE